MSPIEPILKYPRTHHLEGSRCQPGDEDLDAVPIERLAGRCLVIEEKLDGANAGLGFTPTGELRLQSRGHFLTGGRHEHHFDLFKRWASAHRDALWQRIGDRHVVYGEWLYAKHTIFYDELPHYFLEFDVFDRAREQFLSTRRRSALLAGMPVCSVPVVWQGRSGDAAGGGGGGSALDLPSLVVRSRYKSPAWRQRLAEVAALRGLDPARIAAETDRADEMEGLYVKVEDEDVVLERYKWIRASFLTTVLDSGSHWLSRPIVPNQLAGGLDLFAAESPTAMEGAR